MTTNENVPYTLPYDPEEDRRLRLQHNALKYYGGGNFLKPIRNVISSSDPLKILDIGAGSGIWASEVATEFPNSKVFMLDIREQSKVVEFPPNCTFVQGDITKPLPFDNDQFDCIQIRIVPQIRDRIPVYQEVHRIIRPGGYLQMIEIANYTSEIPGPPKPLSEMDRLNSGIFGFGKTFNQATWSLDPIIRKEISEATFPSSDKKLWTNVVFGKIVTPITAWPEDETEKNLGKDQAEQVQRLFAAFRPHLIKGKLMDDEEINKVADELKQALEAVPPPKWSWAYNTVVAEKPSA